MRYIWLLVFCLLSCGAQARPGHMTVPQMVKQSPVIGICRVESVQQVQGLKFAKVTQVATFAFTPRC